MLNLVCVLWCFSLLMMFVMGIEPTGFSYFGAISFSECLPQQAPPGDPVGGEQEGQNPAALLIRMVLMNCQWDQEHVSEAESETESVSWCFKNFYAQSTTAVISRQS